MTRSSLRCVRDEDGGFTATALGTESTPGRDSGRVARHGKDRVRAIFDESMELPKIIRLHFVREEIWRMSCRATFEGPRFW